MEIIKKDTREKIEVVQRNYLFTLVKVDRLGKKFIFESPHGTIIHHLEQPRFMGYEGYALKSIKKIEQ